MGRADWIRTIRRRRERRGGGTHFKLRRLLLFFRRASFDPYRMYRVPEYIPTSIVYGWMSSWNPPTLTYQHHILIGFLSKKKKRKKENSRVSLNSEPCVRKQQHSPSSSSAQLAADNGAVVYRAVRQYEMRNGQFDIGLFEVLYRDPCVMLCSIYCKIGWGRLKLFAIRETMLSVGTQLNCSDVVILMTRSQYAQAKSIFPFFFFFFFLFVRNKFVTFYFGRQIRVGFRV